VQELTQGQRPRAGKEWRKEASGEVSSCKPTKTERKAVKETHRGLVHLWGKEVNKGEKSHDLLEGNG